MRHIPRGKLSHAPPRGPATIKGVYEMIRTFSLHSVAALALATALAAAPATAQDAPIPVAEEDRGDGPITTSQDIVVLGSVGYRNRTEEAEPVLSYDSEFFQRFEPLTAGDALKRVPSVTFLSDVIESDGARLRGLSPGYTQILINGDRKSTRLNSSH